MPDYTTRSLPLTVVVHSRVPTLAALLSVLLLLPASQTLAATIRLVDGSLVIGTITALVDGEDLTVDTDHMGDVVIEWDAIESIDGTAQVNIELFNGERIAGNLRRTEARLFIDSPVREEELEVDPGRVFAIEEYTASWLDGLDAYANLGLNLVRGNNQVTQISYGAGAQYDANRFTTGIDTTLIVNQQENAEDTRRLTLRAFHNQKLTRRWSAGGIYQFESDDRQQLAGRSLYAGVLNTRIINNRVQRLELSAGLALNSENFDTGDSTESLEALAGAVHRLRLSSGLDLDTTIYFLPGLSQSGRYRLQTDSTLSVDLFSDLEFSLIYYNRYDSEPPVAVSTFDYGVTLALGYEF